MEPNAIAQFASVIDPDRPIGSLCALLVATGQAGQDTAAMAQIREILMPLNASEDLRREGQEEADHEYDEEETLHEPPL